MNREIKFRGFTEDKDGDTTIYIDGKETKGRWVYGGSIVKFTDDGISTYYMPNIGEPAISDWDGDNITNIKGNFYSVIPQTVGQWSGKTDKNGEDIYEDDTCRYYYDEANRSYIGNIIYEHGAFCFQRVYGATTQTQPLFNIEYNNDVQELIKIGNRFEIPEQQKGA